MDGAVRVGVLQSCFGFPRGASAGGAAAVLLRVGGVRLHGQQRGERTGHHEQQRHRVGHHEQGSSSLAASGATASARAVSWSVKAFAARPFSSQYWTNQLWLNL